MDKDMDKGGMDMDKDMDKGGMVMDMDKGDKAEGRMEM